MEVIETIIIGFGLSLDAFVVSLGAGAGNNVKTVRGEYRLAFHFGIVQA